MSDVGPAAYSQWIAENRPSDPWGKCEAITRLMAAAFPELRRVRGHYICQIQGRLPHWWMVTPDGQIIDPTRDQFASNGEGAYEPHEGPEPTGTCLNCGELLYGDEKFCNADCAQEMKAYLEESVGEGGGNS
jgi:hypothetical protein